MNQLNYLSAVREYDSARICLFGAPVDQTTSFRPGTRFAPNAIRLESMGLEIYSPYQDQEITSKSICDVGDTSVFPGNVTKTLDAIYEQTKQIVQDHKIPFMIGGEHLVTYPAIKAVAEEYPNLRVVHFDAHTDLRDTFFGEALSHATVIKKVANILGDRRVYQFGIRSGVKEEFVYAQTHQFIEKFSANLIYSILPELKDYPIYITIDLDVLDPSIMPGTGTPEAGGLTFKELLTAVLELKSLNIVGCDVVELAPEQDVTKSSTIVAAKLIRELLIMI